MHEQGPPHTPAESLGMYAAALRRWWPLAIALVAVAGLTGLAVAKQLPKSYDATSKVLLDRQRQVDALLGTSDFSPDPERELNTDVELITLEPIAADVRRSLALPESAAELAERVTTAVDRNSSIVSITVRDSRPARAAHIANAFATAYREYRARSARMSVGDAIASALARMRRLPLGPQRTALRAELRRLRVAEAFQTGGVQIVDRASPSSASSRPRPLANALVGGFLGAVIAALAIVVLARTDRRVRSERDLEALTGRPVIARVPGQGSGAREALVTLAMSLSRPRTGQAPPGLVLLTSPGPREGTAEVALGLARALGTVGRSAIAIEADLREPSFARRLGLGTPGGLAGILRGEDDLDHQLAVLDDGAAALAAGAPCRLPQPLLAGERMAAIVEEACGRADVVLLAGAPVGVVGDALALAGLVDTVVLVARIGETRVDELDCAMRALTDVDAVPIGTVITRQPRGGRLGAVRWTMEPRRAGTAPGAGVAQPGGAAASTTSEVTVG